jgi:hypothetical protein
MSGLHTLDCQLSALLDAPLLFPPSLTFLVVGAPDNATSRSAAINLLIAAIARLPKLYFLLLSLPRWDSRVIFAPFRLSPLRELELHPTDLWELALTQAQAGDVRAMPNLTHIHTPLAIEELRLLLRAPHQLQWQKLRICGPIDAELASLLASLPHLTDLWVNTASDVAFLVALPNLQQLSLVHFVLEEERRAGADHRGSRTVTVRAHRGAAHHVRRIRGKACGGTPVLHAKCARPLAARHATAGVALVPLVGAARQLAHPLHLQTLSPPAAAHPGAASPLLAAATFFLAHQRLLFGSSELAHDQRAPASLASSAQTPQRGHRVYSAGCCSSLKTIQAQSLNALS